LCSITVKGDEPYLNGSQSNLVVNSLGHVLQVYINGKIAGTAREDSTNSFICHLIVVLIFLTWVFHAKIRFVF